MDIKNTVTDQDTETLDNEITAISNEFAETYYLDNEQSEELEILVAKAMKLGELYERKKWQAKATPEGFVLVPKEPTMEMCHRGRNTRSFKVQDIYKAMIEAQEQSHE